MSRIQVSHRTDNFRTNLLSLSVTRTVEQPSVFKHDPHVRQRRSLSHHVTCSSILGKQSFVWHVSDRCLSCEIWNLRRFCGNLFLQGLHIKNISVKSFLMKMTLFSSSVTFSEQEERLVLFFNFLYTGQAYCVLLL